MAEDLPRRQKILGVAERLFGHYGPAKTTMADIARACGIGVGSVYLDFDSKEAILAELGARKAELVAERMIAAARQEDARARLLAMLEARTEVLLELLDREKHGCELFRCTSGQSPGFGEQPRSVLRETITRGVAAGELHLPAEGADIDAVLDAIELAFVGLSPPLLARVERERARQQTLALARLLVFGLTRR